MERSARRLTWFVETLLSTAAMAAGAALLAAAALPAAAPVTPVSPAPSASPAPAAAAGDVPREWLTPAEAAGFEATPDYADTMAFLRRLARRLPEMRLETFGHSASGRPLPLVVVSREHAFTAAAARRLAKPIVLIQNGIHPGEIDGKDACLMLLRDLALGRRRELLDAATLLIVPIYNVDGHERISPTTAPTRTARTAAWASAPPPPGSTSTAIT